MQKTEAYVAIHEILFYYREFMHDHEARSFEKIGSVFWDSMEDFERNQVCEVLPNDMHPNRPPL